MPVIASANVEAKIVCRMELRLRRRMPRVKPTPFDGECAGLHSCYCLRHGPTVLRADLLDARRVKVPLTSRSKDAVLRELVELAAGEHGSAIADAILTSVREREQLLSTGIGSGVAIPHGKTAHIDQLVVAAGVARDPIDFDALDGKPVELFFLLIGPESASGAHVKALSRISRLLRREGLRRELRTAGSGDAFVKVVRASEPT